MFDISQPVVTLLGIGLVASGSAALTGESNLTSAAVLKNLAAAALTAESDLTANGVNVKVASASMSGESNLSASITYVVSVSSPLTAESDLTASATNVKLAAAGLSAESDLTAGAKQIWQAHATLSAQFDLTITTKVVAAAAALANGGSELTANATNVKVATVQPLESDSSIVATVLISAPVAARPLVFTSDLQATVYTPLKYLVLPTIGLTYTDNILLRRYKVDNGQALLINGTTGVLSTFPAQQEIADADYYFRGGAEEILDDTEEAAVIAAGYGQYIVVE